MTQTRFRSFAEQVWGPSRWRRREPRVATIRAYHERLRCAVSHRGDMERTWRRDRRAFYRHRRMMLWRERVTPFHYADHWWAAGYPIVLCESGGDYHAGYAGAYGLTAPAWDEGGGLAFAATAGEATPRQQDLVAHREWVRHGQSAWAPYEVGCAYR